MKKRKISAFLLPYMEAVLKRDDLPYEVVREGKDIFILVNVSARKFSEILEDALCIVQQEKSPSKVQVFSLKTIMNDDKRSRLMKNSGKKSYQILRADMAKAQRILE